MPQIVDERGNPFHGAVDQIIGETITDVRAASVLLAALNAEGVMDLNGHAVALFDLRSAAGTLTVVFEGTIDGTNYLQLPAFDEGTQQYVASIAGAGVINKQVAVTCTGLRRIRARVSAYTSGNVTIAARASRADYIIKTEEIPGIYATNTGAANAAVALTIPAGGAGLFTYINNISITRNATAVLAGTATLVITTTNLPGSPAWSVGNAMAAGGTQIDVNESYTKPLRGTAAATATTIVAPAPGAAVLWRVSAVYHYAP